MLYSGIYVYIYLSLSLSVSVYVYVPLCCTYTKNIIKIPDSRGLHILFYIIPTTCHEPKRHTQTLNVWLQYVWLTKHKSEISGSFQTRIVLDCHVS